MYIHINIHIYTYMHAHTHNHKHKHKCKHKCRLCCNNHVIHIHVFTHTNTHTHFLSLSHSHTHAHTHTHINIRIYTCTCKCHNHDSFWAYFYQAHTQSWRSCRQWTRPGSNSKARWQAAFPQKTVLYGQIAARRRNVNWFFVIWFFCRHSVRMCWLCFHTLHWYLTTKWFMRAVYIYLYTHIYMTRGYGQNQTFLLPFEIARRPLIYGANGIPQAFCTDKYHVKHISWSMTTLILLHVSLVRSAQTIPQISEIFRKPKSLCGNSKIMQMSQVTLSRTGPCHERVLADM